MKRTHTELLRHAQNYNSTEQLLFPFILDLSLSQYVQNEIPYMQECHRYYELNTQTFLSFDDYVVDHYCNPMSAWYRAEDFQTQNDPRNQPDGVVVSWSEYLR